MLIFNKSNKIAELHFNYLINRMGDTISFVKNPKLRFL